MNSNIYTICRICLKETLISEMKSIKNSLIYSAETNKTIHFSKFFEEVTSICIEKEDDEHLSFFACKLCEMQLLIIFKFFSNFKESQMLLSRLNKKLIDLEERNQRMAIEKIQNEIFNSFYCRYCMVKFDAVSFNLFNTSYKGEKLFEILKEIQHFDLHPSDTFSTSICTSCAEDLALAYEIRQKSLRNDRKLRHLVDKAAEIFEDVEMQMYEISLDDILIHIQENFSMEMEKES